MRLPLVHRTMLLALLLLTGCAAMHKQHVANMRAKGDPRASCYEACGPSDPICMKECDNQHRLSAAPASAPASAGGGIDQDTAVRLLTAAAHEDEARKRSASVASANGSDSASSTSTPAPRSAKPSNSGASEKNTSLPPSPTECRPDCEAPRKCVVYLKGTKQCAAGGMCWTVDRDHAECK